MLGKISREAIIKEEEREEKEGERKEIGMTGKN